MRQEIVVGTIREVRNGLHVIARPDGSLLEVAFDGDLAPKLGADIVGSVKHGPGGPRMTLTKSVTDALLKGKARILASGDGEMTARMLSRLLANTKRSILRAGKGACIERVPSSGDTDLNRVLDFFAPASAARGIALNVLDVRELTGATWSDAEFMEKSLPADTGTGSSQVRDLDNLLRSGFTPACHRMMSPYGRNETVNFIIPYSPFAGGWGYARSAGMMNRSQYLRNAPSTSEARILSSAREIARAFASSYMPREFSLSAEVKERWAACFADAAGVLAFSALGGRREIAALTADLKEASLHFGKDYDGTCSRGLILNATHSAIREALSGVTDMMRPDSAESVLKGAARAASAAANQVDLAGGSIALSLEAEQSAEKAAQAVAVDGGSVDAETQRKLAQPWLRDLEHIASEVSGNYRAVRRFEAMAGFQSPIGMEQDFEAKCAALRQAQPQLKASEIVARKDRLAERIRSKMPTPGDDCEPIALVFD